uniref:Uncharacterized protein n=1 Tax=Oryza sativa subsp. japonica TaxID=39947 RepID=Q6K5B8_ORYSJ|nr:hypothetical protein [Oryza sativa Japonica Group]
MLFPLSFLFSSSSRSSTSHAGPELVHSETSWHRWQAPARVAGGGCERILVAGSTNRVSAEVLIKVVND